MDVSCSSFYECIRGAHDLAESISDVLSMIIGAMDSGDIDYGDAAPDTIVLLRQVIADLYGLVARVRKAVSMARGALNY
jgi:hypothetical protein